MIHIKELNKLIIVSCLMLLGCKESKKENSGEEMLCFRNEYAYNDSSGLKDVEELNLTILDGKVNGSYNWLPAEKDQRKGDFTGTLTGDIIKATYTFSQEGTESTAELTIELEDDKAIVTGGKEELGLNRTLTQVNCE
ncbi:MAG: hypothetical protein CML04_01265 [Pseudozobellia sp.]|nr:hypothetical protein [Pseudozobellia sp.]MBG48813.1 hypothetical protein [Pseudozobellia sp.]|tara:strand:- start:196 stop:609 length:414 start_codon:yes stop_codon:yes gene_type:complete